MASKKSNPKGLILQANKMIGISSGRDRLDPKSFVFSKRTSTTTAASSGGRLPVPPPPPGPPPNPAETCTDPGCAASRFDGINDGAFLPGTFTGQADTKVATVSFWAFFNQDRSTGTEEVVIEFGSGGGIAITRSHFGVHSNEIKFNGFTGATFSLDVHSTAVLKDDWHHVLMSFDLAVPGSARLYIDDVSALGEELIFNNENIKLGGVIRCSFCGRSLDISPSRLLDGDISEFYYNIAEYIDFNVESNRRKFITAGLLPVDLGADGSTPTTNSPMIYFPKGDPQDNHGSGLSDMTLVGDIELVAGPGV